MSAGTVAAGGVLRGRGPRPAVLSLLGEVQGAMRVGLHLSGATDDALAGLENHFDANAGALPAVLTQLFDAWDRARESLGVMEGHLHQATAHMLSRLEHGQSACPQFLTRWLHTVEHHAGLEQAAWQALRGACGELPDLPALCNAYAARRDAELQATGRLHDAQRRLVLELRHPMPGTYGGLV